MITLSRLLEAHCSSQMPCVYLTYIPSLRLYVRLKGASPACWMIGSRNQCKTQRGDSWSIIRLIWIISHKHLPHFLRALLQLFTMSRRRYSLARVPTLAKSPRNLTIIPVALPEDSLVLYTYSSMCSKLTVDVDFTRYPEGLSEGMSIMLSFLRGHSPP